LVTKKQDSNKRWYFVTFLEFLDALSCDQFIEKNPVSIRLWIYLLWKERCPWLPSVRRQLQPSSTYSARKICAAGLSKHSKLTQNVAIQFSSPW